MDKLQVKRHLLGKKVYFVLISTNKNLIIGYNKLKSININKDGSYYKIENYPSYSFSDVFETLEELLSFITDYFKDTKQ